VSAAGNEPQSIGPYEVLRRLGAGGMGEVFLAYDARLDRRVALKRVRGDGAAAAPEQRVRFRREARLAAGIGHPAVVQVHDLLETAAGDYLVMEYVEGESLRQRLARGLPPIPEAIAIAGQVASGLAAAHARGVVHRDLKTENVLLTADGRAKIADFGTARHLLGEETRLTAADAVVGTCRAMSPEQAHGEEVGPRSDLFSFGVLLYETLTGVSPFTGQNPLAVLERVTRHRPPPLETLRPEVPDALAALVAQLLEKEPEMRPRSAAEVARALERLGATAGEATLAPGETARVVPARPLGSAGSRSSAAVTAVRRRPALWAGAAALALAAAGIAAFLATRPPPPLYVAVLPVSVVSAAGFEPPALLAPAVREAELRTLLGLDGVSPKSFDEVDAVAGPPAQVARAVAADELVGARLDCGGAACRITLTRWRGTDASLLSSDSFDVPADNFYLVASAVATHLRQGYRDRRTRGDSALSVSRRDFAAFLDLRQRFDSRREPSLTPILEGLAEVRRRSPSFLDAYVLEADVARYAFYSSRDPRHLEHAREVLRTARRLAPEDPQPLFVETDVALAAGDLAAAGAALDRLAKLVPGDVRLQERQARWLVERGEGVRGLALMRRAVRQHPSWKRLLVLAHMEYRQGETEAAREHLGQLLARAANNRDGLSLLAEIELASGDPARAAKLYLALVQQNPALTQLSNLGLAELLRGRYSAAASAFNRALEQAPANPMVALNLADAYELLGRSAEAAGLYGRTLDLAAADPSQGTPQMQSVRAQALAHLGRGAEAVTAVQDALRRAPDDAAIAYEAALVYALLGESHSAVANAERAVDEGFGAAWLELPWFGRLRHTPEFQRLIQRARRAAPPA
jgi:tetratricopeptide (TPR) repeat protein